MIKLIARQIQTVTKSQGRLVILGSGWGGNLSALNRKFYDVVVVSPRNYYVFTPLLASTAVGTLEFRCITEPIRYHAKDVEVYEARCDAIDFNSKTLKCKSVLAKQGDPDGEFSLSYDKLVIACGAVTNTFNIPGVQENAFFLKDISDAKKIRGKVIECFEKASQPNVSEAEKWELLSFVVVGGGPTGIEFSAELHDFVTEDMLRLYPDLANMVTMTVYDVSSKILSSFDESLSEYAMNVFQRKGIKLKLNTKVVEVAEDHLILHDGTKVPFGLLVWSTGLSPNPLIKSDSFNGINKTASHQLIVDQFFRVQNKDGKPLDGVFALGDCSYMKLQPLPATAQVAAQQGQYLATLFQKHAKQPEKNLTDIVKPFNFFDRGSMAYVGNWSAVVDLKSAQATGSGTAAWLFWRSAYFTMTVSTKNKILIPMFWFLSWIFGRDISRI